MPELNDLMRYAISLEFNPPQGADGVAVVGVTFANAQYCRDAYFQLKSQLNGEKININLKIDTITLVFIAENLSGEPVFSAELNYDPGYLSEFTEQWPPGQPIAMVFGAKRNCSMYIINPEGKEREFQPFFVNKYEVTT